jgi:hypothetical protein
MLVIFSRSPESAVNYKKSTSTDQIQYQSDEPIFNSRLTDKLADDLWMKPEYDDGMTVKTGHLIFRSYLTI